MTSQSSAKAKKASANDLYKEGNFNGAIVKYSELIDDAPMSDEDLHIYYSNRCACYLKLNRNQ